MDLFNFLLFSLLLLLISVLLFRKKPPSKLPPGPVGLPILGNLITVGDRPHETLAKMAKTYGPLMTVRIGSNTTVVASTAEAARTILQTHDQAFLGRPVPDAVTAEDGYELSIAWLPGGPKWRALRKLLNSEIFTAQRLDALQHLRQDMMESMARRLAGASVAGESVDIGRLVFATTMNMLSNTMFSGDIVDPESKTIEELKELIGKIMLLAGKPNLSDFFPAMRALDLQGIRKEIKVSYDRLHVLVDEIIDRRMRRRSEPSDDHAMWEKSDSCDFLDVLLDSQDRGPEELTRPDIRILLMDLFIGGTDTTTTTMEWAMTELLRNPDILAKTRQELDDNIVPNQTKIKESDITKLPYLQSVLKEAMRLHPTAPLLLPHRALTDVEVNGFTVPKGTQILVNYWAVSRDPQHWDDPDKFSPERFLGEKSLHVPAAAMMNFRGTNFTFTPFGSGCRICPGLSMGVRMLSLLLATLVHRFDWRLPHGMRPKDIDVRDKFGVTLQRVTPLVATPVIRNN